MIGAVDEHDPIDTRAHQQAQAQRDDRARLTAKTEADDLVWLLSSKRGRRMAWRQLERAGVFRLSFNTNAMQMAFAEGARNEGLRLLSQIHAVSPDAYPLMLRESLDEGSGQ